MTKKVSELQRRSYDKLLYAVENMQSGADVALREFQKIREEGGTPLIWWSAHHGWVITRQ